MARLETGIQNVTGLSSINRSGARASKSSPRPVDDMLMMNAACRAGTRLGRAVAVRPLALAAAAVRSCRAPRTVGSATAAVAFAVAIAVATHRRAFSTASAASSSAATADSHLLLRPLHGWAPQFDRLTSRDIEEGMRALLPTLHAQLDRLEADIAASLGNDTGTGAGSTGTSEFTAAECAAEWARVIDAADRIDDRLSVAWSTVAHLQGVRDSPCLRAAVAAVEPELIAFRLRLAQSRALHAATVRLDARGGAHLSATQRRVLALALRDARLRYRTEPLVDWSELSR
jgi:hypothetical protein